MIRERIFGRVLLPHWWGTRHAGLVNHFCFHIFHFVIIVYISQIITLTYLKWLFRGWFCWRTKRENKFAASWNLRAVIVTTSSVPILLVHPVITGKLQRKSKEKLDWKRTVRRMTDGVNNQFTWVFLFVFRVLKPPGGGTSELFATNLQEANQKPGLTQVDSSGNLPNGIDLVNGKSGKTTSYSSLSEGHSTSDVSIPSSVISAEIKNLSAQIQKRQNSKFLELLDFCRALRICWKRKIVTH